MDTQGARNGRSEAPRALRMRLFGPLTIEDGVRVLGPRDLGGARPKQVLEILLAARGHRVPTDRLADLPGRRTCRRTRRARFRPSCPCFDATSRRTASRHASSS
jgi:hypothetical protein